MLCGTVINNRTNMHFADHLSPTDPAVNEWVNTRAQRNIGQGFSPDHAQSISLHSLSSIVMNGATTMAFSDTFYLLMVCFLLTVFLVPLMKKPRV
ncbi:hypothetical protein GA565_12015 [Rouxiella sp. S1S-2]|uniref:hypothetical protein n=1 Tax=Rouxiella sp. S1S-2 TaxID=2653856 RepID=UPI001264D2C5|nr:hypothetical protein [Rouxiella sp. S1S-2]KAB7896644.1 hypothetical protein GA565_12015 [Rouxiella sp. S1S-2]